MRNLTQLQPTNGIKLEKTLRGHTEPIYTFAWSPDGGTIAAASSDGTVRLWDSTTGECLFVFKPTTAVSSLAFHPDSRSVAFGTIDGSISLRDVVTKHSIRIIKAYEHDRVSALVFEPTGKVLCSGGPEVKFWDAVTGDPLRASSGHGVAKRPKPRSHAGATIALAYDLKNRTLISVDERGFVDVWDAEAGELIGPFIGEEGRWVWDIALHPNGEVLAIGSSDYTVQLWDRERGRLLRSLEGHTGSVGGVKFSPDGALLASSSGDLTARIWNCESWSEVAVIPDGGSPDFPTPVFFHPSKPYLATVGTDLSKEGPYCLLCIWQLDLPKLLGSSLIVESGHYVNAKVVLLGDTGVGKSGLSMVLNGQPFAATDSTPGRKVWTFDTSEVTLGRNLKQRRETLLWDLAGQPGYRVIHQLHLNEIAVALIVFDARSEIDPLAGVRHWERALRLAMQRQGPSAIPMKKFLVSARTDRGTVSVSKERLDSLLSEFGFDGYFETSAKEGWQVRELQKAIREGIEWEQLPEVTSSFLFADIKSFLLRAKESGRLVARANQLYDDFVQSYPQQVAASHLRAQFDTCVGRLENRDLIRRLSFGGYVLLQPELLDAYASAMVNAAKKEPDGLGSIAEDVALNGQFYVPQEQKVSDRGQEQLLLHATVEELVRHDLALRESATDGRYLVFPSEFVRDYEAAPEPKGKALAIMFDGPVQSLYSTLAVRLGHSGLFTTGRAEMWRNAAVFTAKAGGKCGLYLHEFEEARGRLIIFYDAKEGLLPTQETRFHFEEFVLAHAQRHALAGTIRFVRFFVCSNGHPVPDEYVKLLTEQGKKVFDCPCGMNVSLAEPKERIHFDSQVAAMDRSADRQRAFEVFVESARGETITPGFTDWAGDDRVTLAIVFTDVVGSTALGQRLGDARMEELRRAHFDESRKLITQHKGREIKTIGDSFMAAFKSVGKALDYAMALQKSPGHSQIEIRAGIHIGPMTVEENDVFGGTVNFAARVVGSIRGPEIWLSERAKEDLDGSGAKQHSKLKWERKDGIEMKGFNGTFTLWALTK